MMPLTTVPEELLKICLMSVRLVTWLPRSFWWLGATQPSPAVSRIILNMVRLILTRRQLDSPHVTVERLHFNHSVVVEVTGVTSLEHRAGNLERCQQPVQYSTVQYSTGLQYSPAADGESRICSRRPENPYQMMESGLEASYYQQPPVLGPHWEYFGPRQEFLQSLSLSFS